MRGFYSGTFSHVELSLSAVELTPALPPNTSQWLHPFLVWS